MLIAKRNLRDHPLLRESWYFPIELEPGLVTPGKYGRSAILTRAMLRNCEVDGQRCLDIGPMEGLISALLARRGAANITAIDVTPVHAPKIDLIKSALNFEMDLIAPMRLSRAANHFRAMNVRAFDVVVFSGVLYHVLDIASALTAVRTLVRTGGLVVIETWLLAGDEGIARLNRRGRFTDEPNTFWFVDVAMLDYLLRLLWLRPLDCAYYVAPDQSVRLATTCRALDQPDSIDDPWMQSTATGSADLSYLKEDMLPSKAARELNYTSKRTERGSIPLMMETRLPLQLNEEKATLWLSDKV